MVLANLGTATAGCAASTVNLRDQQPDLLAGAEYRFKENVGVGGLDIAVQENSLGRAYSPGEAGGYGGFPGAALAAGDCDNH